MRMNDRWYLHRKYWEALFVLLEKLGFIKATCEQIISGIQKNGGVKYLKKRTEGMESGYVFQFKFWKIYIWTTYVDAIKDINEHDYIWAVIVDERSRQPFFWFPMKRTLNFVDTAYSVAKMLIEIIYNWPVCPECEDKLFLVFVPKIMHLMKFVCGNSHFVHSAEVVKMFYPIIDMPLSDESHKILYDAFKRSLEDQHKISLSDEPHEFARNIRAENKRKAQQEYNEKNNFYGDIID